MKYMTTMHFWRCSIMCQDRVCTLVCFQVLFMLFVSHIYNKCFRKKKCNFHLKY